jgi:MoaA/NifB/PqqE/SkfB family radical SAM enzyme
MAENPPEVPAAPQVRFHQIEITTRCNFQCFYCAGRDMAQRDMPWERFEGIVERIGGAGATVSLQGEGEPSMHPRFWDMVAHVIARGHVPYTILNGSRIDLAQVAKHFPVIAVSIDTLDDAVAERIGRPNLRKVLHHLAEMVLVMGPQRIEIMSVDVGQPLGALRQWARETGFRKHVVQPLQPKADYGRRYRVQPPRPLRRPVPMSCRFIEGDAVRYYTLDGLVLPCAFIKDPTGIESIEGLKAMLGRGEVPVGCSGCVHLRAKERLAS